MVHLPPVMVRKPCHPVTGLVIQQREGAGGVPALARVAFLVERPHPGPRPQDARLADARHQLVAFVQHQLHLPRLDAQQLGVGHLLVGGADDGHGVGGHDDVAIGGHLAAVDHRVDDPVVHGHHDALARDYIDGDARPALPPSPPRRPRR